jgi:hypothetical protein
VGALIAGLLLFASRMALYRLIPVPAGYSPANILLQFVRGAAAFFLVFGITGMAGRWLNRGGAALAWARDMSFSLYVLHYLPLTVATFLLLKTDCGLWTRWTLSVLASWISVLLFAEVSRFVPPLARFLGIRPLRARTPVQP